LEKERFYDKDLFMWIMFGTLSPIGIILMWKNKRYRVIPRIITSVLYLFYFLIISGTIGSENSGLSFTAEFIRLTVFFVIIPYIVVHWNKIYQKILILMEKYSSDDNVQFNRNSEDNTVIYNEIKGEKNKNMNNNNINKVALFYEGGYPGYHKSFSALITRNDNEIIFLSRNTLVEKFRININDIIEIKHHYLDKSMGKTITITLKYKENKIEMIFSSGLLSEKKYSQLMALVYSDNIKPFNAKKERKGIIVALTIAFIVIMMAVITTNTSNKKNTNTNTKSTVSQTPTDIEKTTDNTTSVNNTDDISPSNAVVDDGSIKEGMYKVGTDLSAGEYVIITNNSEQGYMQITKDSTGTFDSIISNENIANRTYVTVNDTEYLTVKSGKIYPLDKAPKIDTSSGTLSDGMYKVGTDIQAGEYKINSPSNGYIEITSGSRHTLDGIISNDNFTGDKYITIQDGQYMKLHNATLTLNN
jgi:hypothetical protein